MILTSLKFCEALGRETEWTLDDLTFSAVNLLVGKNATGKTRTINVIHFLSTLLTGQRQEIISSGRYETVFKKDDDTWEYELEFNNGIVTREKLIYNGDQVLHRSEGGIGRIRTEDVDGQKVVTLRFSVPGSRLAIVTKRDDLQHPFLRPMLDWAESVRLFRFGGGINPYNLALAVKEVQIQPDERDTNQLVPVFHKGIMEFPETYLSAILKDMSALGYDLEAIVIRRPADLIVNAILPGELMGISVKERGVPGFVDQPSISQGMFRALSLVAQVNYYALAKKRACLLVDDIGEGLDFERSCAVIDVLREKAQASGFQVIMATNDRFVMNRVPLEEWCLLQRNGSRVKVRNYGNSKDAFERFKMTGLSNFDFLRYDFINENPENVFEEVGSGTDESTGGKVE